MTISKTYGFALILTSFLIAWFIANVGVNYDRMELGALANLFVPPVCGFASLFLFAVVDYFYKKPRLIIVILLILFNLYVGITIRLES
jgi:hypothetical protein